MSGRGIVFSGGGAYGAYEAGVLSYLADHMTDEAEAARYDYVSGTSVGAFHAAFAAGSMHEPKAQINNLLQAWRSLDLNEIFHVRFRTVLDFLGGGTWLGGAWTAPKHALLDTSFLDRHVLPAIDWRNIRGNVSSGRCRGVAVAATRIEDGRTVIFHDVHDDTELLWKADQTIVGLKGRVGPRQVLASAALPIAFAPVQVGNELFADGSIRLNTPLSPMLHFGADRILLIRLHTDNAPRQRGPIAEEQVANPAYLLGRIMQALMTESLDQEMARIRMFNDILTEGTDRFGAEFVRHFNDIISPHRGHDMQVIDVVTLEPSVSLSQLAFDLIGKVNLDSRLTRKFFDWMQSGAATETDLLGFLFFDKVFADALIELGREDARKAEASLDRVVL